MKIKNYLLWVTAGLFIAGALMVFSIIFSLGSHLEPGRWVAECLQKKSILVARHNPRLVILSASNALFGFSARTLSEKYNTPTVNLSVHAGLGPNYILDYGRRFIEKDRIFVLPLEYELYTHPSHENAFIFQVAGFDVEYFWRMPLKQKISFITSLRMMDRFRLLRYKIQNTTAVETTVYMYDSKNLNDYGDETANKPENITPSMHKKALRKAKGNYIIDESVWDEISQFTHDVEAAGGQVILTYPNIYEGALDMNESFKFFSDLRNRAQRLGVKLVGDPKEATFDQDRAFDTTYHQNTLGQAISTDRLYSDLHHAGII
jgi:hypothetical protein